MKDRDLFAGMALIGLIIKSNIVRADRNKPDEVETLKKICSRKAEGAYLYADEMIQRRWNKEDFDGETMY